MKIETSQGVIVGYDYETNECIYENETRISIHRVDMGVRNAIVRKTKTPLKYELIRYFVDNNL